MIIQEDNAPVHKSHYQGEVYNLWRIMKLLWLENSPNLNVIEKAQYYMKKETTRRGPTSNRAKLRARWEKCWADLPQRKIQEQIEAILYYVKEIIRLKGGNEYKEGREKGQEKTVIYQNK